MNISHAKKHKECWNCNRPYDDVTVNPGTGQIIGICNGCGSIHGLGYAEKEKVNISIDLFKKGE